MDVQIDMDMGLERLRYLVNHRWKLNNSFVLEYSLNDDYTTSINAQLDSYVIQYQMQVCSTLNIPSNRVKELSSNKSTIAHMICRARYKVNG